MRLLCEWRGKIGVSQGRFRCTSCCGSGGWLIVSRSRNRRRSRSSVVAMSCQFWLLLQTGDRIDCGAMQRRPWCSWIGGGWWSVAPFTKVVGKVANMIIMRARRLFHLIVRSISSVIASALTSREGFSFEGRMILHRHISVSWWRCSLLLLLKGNVLFQTLSECI